MEAQGPPPQPSYDWGSDDEQDDLDSSEPPVFTPGSGNGAMEPVSVLTVGVGQLSAIALDAGLGVSEWGVVGTLDVAGCAAESVMPTITEVRLSKVDGGASPVASVSVQAPLPAADVNRWAAVILDTLKPRSVEIAIDQPLHKLRGFGTTLDDECTLVFVLKTSQASETPGEPPILPPPNLVDGPGAALLSLCEARGVSARATIVYRPQGGSLRGADSTSLAAFDTPITAAVRAGVHEYSRDELAARRAQALSRAQSSSSPSAAVGMMYL